MVKFLTLAACLFATTAIAQEPKCGPYEHVTNFLGSNYGETLAFQGIAANGKLLQTFVNLESRTWTIIFVSPVMEACLGASGTTAELYEPVPYVPPVDEDPA